MLQISLAIFFTITSLLAEEHNVIGCEIFSMEKKLLRKFPGELCAFTDDGSILSTEEERIVYYDKNLKIKWTLPIKAHHQVNLNLKKDKFLLIGSDIVKQKNAKPARSDVLYIVNKSGKIEKKFDLFKEKAQFDKKYWVQAQKRKFPVIWTPSRFSDAEWELTHVNSFYEIDAKFNHGSFIVNDISLMLVFTLSADLKKVVWQSHLSSDPWTMLHDVQVLRNGNLLYYDNGTKSRPYSTLIEYDLKNSKIVWQYERTPKESFYAVRWGGIQRLENGNTLFSDITKGPISIEITKDGHEVWNMKSPPQTYLQQIKRQDLTKFLYHNKGL